MIPYSNGAGAVDQNFRVDSGSTTGSVAFTTGSLLNGRSYAISIVVAPSKFNPRSSRNVIWCRVIV